MSRILSAAFFFALLISASARATEAENTKELNDEIRALLVKSKAIMKRFDDGRTETTTASGDVLQVQRRQGPRHGTNGRRAAANGESNDQSGPPGANGCQLNVGNNEQTQSRGGIRRVTTVVTGNVIQMCN